MKNLANIKVLLAGLLVITCFLACKKDYNNIVKKSFNMGQVNLVADINSLGAARVDTNLVNAWGIAIGPTGGIWISANHTGLTTIYNSTGQTLIPPVTIPAAQAGQTGSPTGVVFNATTDFGGNKFIFASEDGIITAWKSGSSAVVVADRSASDAVYKSITMTNDGTANFLYATNFKGGKIDVFDKNFNYVTNKPFVDAAIPAGFAPFNIENIGGKLYVTYAKLQGPDNEDDPKGPGNGYVDIFNPDGTLVRRFASQGELNSPWGIALAPAGFADNEVTILIGNFGNGRINIFDMGGNFRGQLQNNGQPITIEGLWAVNFLKNNIPDGSSSDPLYFTAGPSDESHGLFGYLQKQ